MKNKTIYRIMLVIFFFIMLIFPVFPQAVIRAEITASEYSVGDMVKVHIKVKKNPGLHGLYFDMDYNGGILSFEKIEDEASFPIKLKISSFAF